MKKNTLFKALTIAISIAQTLLLSGCGLINKPFSITKNGLFFDTIVSITVIDDDSDKAEKASKYSLELCEKYEKMFSATIPESDIARINSSAGNTNEENIIKISEETTQLLKKSIFYSELSDGEFDITIDPISNLWDFHGDENTAPKANQINTALKHVDYHHIILERSNNKAYLNDKDASIEIGGIAKGYIADKIADYLSEQGVTGALINMGGDIKVIGKNQNGVDFSIGINDPSNTGTPLFPVYLSDYSIATSGTYERSFTDSEGNFYHHILNPKTGYPAITDVTQASVLTRNSVDADALATICIIKGSRDALDFIEKLEDTEVILITTSGEVIKSSGISQYLNNSQ